jgi:hypothetical protein
MSSFGQNDVNHGPATESTDDLPQFAVIARSFRVLSRSGSVPTVALKVGRNRKPSRCVLDKPKAYLVSAVDADAAMSVVRRYAASKGIDVIVHRAVEACQIFELTKEEKR